MLHIDNHDPDRKAALAVPAMNRLRRQRYLPPTTGGAQRRALWCDHAR
jgi:hypothetical protein